MFSSRKAVSPLIAAVLLIVVTIGIGAVVVGMIRGYVTDSKAQMQSKADEMACSRDVSIEVTRISGEPQVCRGNYYLDIVVENPGIAIDDFQLVVFGDAGIFRNDSTGYTVSAGGTSEIKVNYTSGSVGTPLQFKLVPKLKKPGSAGYFFCTDVALTEEGVQACT
jgi:FlaG/FlaF family flagellin (archaellin)